MKRFISFVLIVGLSGCLTPLNSIELALNAKSATFGNKQVRTAGACFDLGEGHQAAYKAEEFVAKTSELLAAGRNASAQHLVSLYPDLCQDALHRVSNADVGKPAIELIAKAHDSQLGLTGTPLSWAALMQERKASPFKFADYDTARARAIESKSVASAGLPKLASHPLLQIDAHRLTADAYLQVDEPAKAVPDLTAALKITQDAYGYQSVQLQLMLGEAWRRNGKIEQAVGSWQQAVMLAGKISTGAKPIADPILWESIAALRPANTAWPEPVIVAAMPQGAIRRSAGADEAYLWKRLGHWRLERGEPQAALLAFKRAESMCIENSLQEDLQILQASALVQLSQSAAAAAILTPLVDKPRPNISAAALSMLGAMKLQMGAGPQASTLLKKAFEVGGAGEWPGRADAEADFALASMLTNDAAQGIERLHAAQQRFASAGNMFMLRQCLENEAAYWTRVGNTAESERLRTQLAMLEQNKTVARQ